MRANKPFTIIATSPKKEAPILRNHCRFHTGTKLIGGYLCEHCGPTLPAIRIVDTIEEKEKSS